MYSTKNKVLALNSKDLYSPILSTIVFTIYSTMSKN